MQTPFPRTLRAIAGLAIFPAILLALLLLLGRNLDEIIDEPEEPAATSAPIRTVSARSATFGSQRALADAAAVRHEADSE